MREASTGSDTSEKASDSEGDDSEEEREEEEREEQAELDEELLQTGHLKAAGNGTSSFSRIPYTELCDIQCAVRDALAGELQWSFRNYQAHERWPQGAPKSLHIGQDAAASVPDNFSTFCNQRCAAATKSEGAVAPHTCIPHPSHDPGCWAADDDTCGGFKWPKLFEEAPAVPQTISEGGNSDLRRAQVLNSFAGEQWTDSKSHVPLCIFGFPSIEHTQALKEHLSTSAFLPSLVADGKEAEQRGSKAQNSQRAMGLESADKSESRRYLKDHYIGKHVDATHTTIHKVVEQRLQPARAELKSLFSTCLPIAAAATARAVPATPQNRLEGQPDDRAESDVMAALLAGEQQLNEKQLPSADVDPALEALHSDTAEAAVNVGASIVNNALSQMLYPSKVAWTRCKSLVHKTRSKSIVTFLPDRNPFLMAAPAHSHLLAPGHAPFADSSTPLGPTATDTPHVYVGAATGRNGPSAACSPQEECVAQFVQARMAAAMPATLRKVPVTWLHTDSAGAAPSASGALHNSGLTTEAHATSAQNQVQGQDLGDTGNAHPLHVMAIQLAKARGTAAEAGRRSGHNEVLSQRGSGGAALGQTQTAEASTSAGVESNHVVHGLVNSSAPIISQPVVQPLPASTVCHLLDNAAQFRVVIEFENLAPCEETIVCTAATSCVDAAVVLKTRARDADKARRDQAAVRQGSARQQCCMAKGHKKQHQQAAVVQQQRWFTVEVPLNKNLASMFVRWPADSGPVTRVGGDGTHLIRFYLKRCSGFIRPESLLQQSDVSAFTPHPSNTGGCSAPFECTADAERAPVSFLYPSAADAGLIPTIWGRPELQGMFVAQHWSAAASFTHSCRFEHAAQSFSRLRAPDSSQAAPQNRVPVWALLRDEIPSFQDSASASASFSRRRDLNKLSAHPLVCAALREFRAFNPAARDAVAAPAQERTRTAAAQVTESATNSQQAAECPWLVAAGYLGTSLADMLCSSQAPVQGNVHGDVKCHQDELVDLVQQNLIIESNPSKGLQVGVKRYSGAQLHRRYSAASSDNESLQEPNSGAHDGKDSPSSVDLNSTEEGSRKHKRKSEDNGHTLMQQTEVMGIPLQEVAMMRKSKQQKVCKNGTAVQRALSDVVRIEEETGSNLGGASADVTMMFRGAHACGVPTSILQRAAERWKKIMASQRTTQQLFKHS